VLTELGVCAGGTDGDKLLGPKMSPRVAGTGDISPVDGVAENSEFWALAAGGISAIATTNHNADHGRTRTAAVADALFMTWLFSAEIEAISSRAYSFVA
jgi:hypothetical protein